MSFPIFFAPWLIVGVSIVVLDILASVYYIIDLVDAMVSSKRHQLPPSSAN